MQVIFPGYAAWGGPNPYYRWHYWYCTSLLDKQIAN